MQNDPPASRQEPIRQAQGEASQPSSPAGGATRPSRSWALVGRGLAALPRRWFWRRVYDWLATQGPDRFSFMNYGFVPDHELDAPSPEAVSDETLPRQLYEHVLGDGDLRGSSLLEIGCGRAGGLEWVARVKQPARTVGVDLSSRAVELARRRTSDLPNLEILQGDAARTGLPSGAFDIVLNVESSHCYPSRERFYREAYRLLSSGGALRHADFFTSEGAGEARRALDTCGFAEVRERDITPNVLEALRRDARRKQDLIGSQPRVLEGLLRQFCALEGTDLFEGFSNGTFAYLSFVCVRG